MIIPKNINISRKKSIYSEKIPFQNRPEVWCFTRHRNAPSYGVTSKTRNVSMRHGCPRGDCKVRTLGLVKNCLTPRYISAKCTLNIVENYLNRTTSELDLCILVTHYWNFSKSKGHNSAENYSTGPKFKLNLRILLTHLYTEFQFKMSTCNGDNERKLKIEFF